MAGGPFRIRVPCSRFVRQAVSVRSDRFSPQDPKALCEYKRLGVNVDANLERVRGIPSGGFWRDV